MVEYTKGQQIVIVSNKVIRHCYTVGQVCQIERLYSSNHGGHAAYEVFYEDHRGGKHRQVISAYDMKPLDVSSNEVALGFLEEKSPW